MEEERNSSSEEDHHHHHHQHQQHDVKVSSSHEVSISKLKGKPRISYIREVCDLPQTKMRALLKAAFPEFIIDEDALIALTKAAELIVQELAAGGYKESTSNLLRYENVSTFVKKDRRRAIAVLRDIFPPRHVFGDIKKAVLNVKDDEDA